MLCDSSVPLLDLYTTELCACSHQKTWAKTFIAGLLVIVQAGIFLMPINNKMADSFLAWSHSEC